MKTKKQELLMDFDAVLNALDKPLNKEYKEKLWVFVLGMKQRFGEMKLSEVQK